MRIRSNVWLALAVVAAPAMAGAQNIALGKTTAASSNYLGTSFTAPGNAVDGSRNGNYYVGKTFHSNADPLAWWYVDLGADYAVSTIDFYNRSDCCSERIIGSTIGVWATLPFTGANPTPVWSATFSGIGSTTATPGELLTTFSPGGAIGRYIGISKRGEYLQIAEVEVAGTLVPTSAVPEPATVGLIATGLVALGAMARRRRTTTA